MTARDPRWPVDRLYEVVGRLAGGAGGPGPVVDAARFDQSLTLACRRAGVEAHAAEVVLDRLDAALWPLAPALVRVGDRHLLALPGGRGRVLTPDGAAVRIGSAALRKLLGARPPAAVEVSCAPSPAAAALLALASPPTAGGTVTAWALRPSPGAAPRQHLVRARVPGRAVRLAVLHGLRLLLLAVSWWMLGRGAVEGGLDAPLLAGWGLLVATLVGVTAAADHLQGHLLLDLHVWYRRRTVHGATRVSPRLSRTLGSGQLLGRIFEADALDTIAVNAGLGAVTAAIDAAFCLALFLAIPGAGPLAAGFAAWLAGVLLAGGWLVRLQHAWTLQRVAMSEDVVEALLGRRTRLALGGRRVRPVEDRTLERYVRTSAQVDRAEIAFETVAGRGWLLVGLPGLPPTAGWSSMGPGPTAAALGGVLLGFQALGRAAAQVHLVAALAISWRQARVLYRAAAVPDLVGVPELVEGERRAGPVRGPLLRARGLGHCPDPARAPVLDQVSLRIRPAERVLLTGASGSGKTTLARLLAGLEAPTSGTVALRGLDRRSLGEHEWAQRVAYVPPFCDNHVFSTSFLHNLLPGHWPPRPEQVAEAEQVCRELGLGPLLDRMPDGLHQTVGETGWRLSHGERSRLFLARAILQHPELVILDESFGALDPDTQQDCLDCVLRRVPTLVLISHT